MLSNSKETPDLGFVYANPALLQMMAAGEYQSHLGVTQEYKGNRELFDNPALRKQFKDETFGDRKTIKDRVTGEAIHKDHGAALHKYKRQSAPKHASETDHIVSLKRGHARLKKNPFLTDKDVRDILNDKRYNYREVSKRFNSSKGESSDLSKLSDLPREGKVQVVKEGFNANAGILAKSTVLTAKNMGNEFAQGAAESLQSAAIPIMVESVRNLISVANGEKEFKQAAKDVGKLTTQIAVSGGGLQVAKTGLANVLKNSSNDLLKSVGNSNQVAQIITVSIMLAQSIGRYANGELNGEQFFQEIGEKGVGLVAGSIGAIIGQAVIPIPYVGALVGSMIISTACMSLYKGYMSLNEHEKKLDRVNAIASQALAEMERQRTVLQAMAKEQFAKWDAQIQAEFDQMYRAALQNDSEGVAGGLDRLLQVFGQNVAFKSMQEFDDFFMDEKATFTF